MDIIEILKILFWIFIIAWTVFYFTKSVKRFFQVAGGLAAFESVNGLLDFGLWPIIQGSFGYKGIIVLFIFALIFNFFVFKLYQKMGIDWLGIIVTDDIIKKSEKMLMEWKIKNWRKKILLAPITFFLRFLSICIKVKVIAFFVFSLFWDPVIAMALFVHRKYGSAYIKLKLKDYIFFLLSTSIACFGWTIFNWIIIIPAFKNIWSIFF
ncbi:MAG: hypothetical protein V1910_00420 [bacterium]